MRATVNTATELRATVPRNIALDLADLEPPPTRAADPRKTQGGLAIATADPIGAGSLSSKHVARLIFDLAETSATGTLSLAHGKVRKDLYVRAGQVVAADSNLRQEALGALLCAKGIIDETQLTFLLSETKSRGHKMGAVIIELGWLRRKRCCNAWPRRRANASWIACAGAKAVTASRPAIPSASGSSSTISMSRKRFCSGSIAAPRPKPWSRRFDQSGACPVQLTYRFDRYKDELRGDQFGGDISLMVADAPTVGALALREDAHVVMAEIDALIETGLAALGSPMVDGETAAGRFESSFSLEKLGTELGKRFDATAQSAGDVSFSDVNKSDVSLMPASPPYTGAADETSSGALAIGYAVPRKPDGSQAADGLGVHAVNTPTENLRQRLLREYLMIYGKSHYDILGVTPQTASSHIEEAVHAKLEQFPARAVGIDLAPADRMRLEAVRAAIAQAGRVLSDVDARKDYDRALVATQMAPVDPLGAELAFGEGLQLFQSDRLDEALVKFEAAVTARPDQALYHAYLGWTDFVARGPDKASDARDRLLHALALDPDLAEAHAMLGRLAATEDDAATARRHLERSLAIDPVQPDTIDLLLEAYARLPDPDPRDAERFLRKLVSALGERAEPLRKRLWRELGDLYENSLSDRNSARIAYDTAARLAPKNIDILHKSLELNAEDPARWRETAHALTAEWQLHPHEASPAAKLLELYQQQGLPDAAQVTAAAMVLRGLADDRSRKIAESGRPLTLRQIPGPLPSDLLDRAGYRPQESDLEDLAALLVETGVLKPFGREELGLLESDVPLAQREQPAAFRQVLHYVCGLFEVGVPRDVISLPVLGGDARLADLRPPSLLCGPMLLDSEDTVELGFRLSRAMALGAPGRLAGSARSGGQMRPYFVAALALAHATAPAQGVRAQEATQAIAALDEGTRARLRDHAQKISRKYDNLNLSIWGRGLARVATRLALLISGDLMRVGRAVAEEEGPAALDDLLAFALSLEHLDLRRDMGLAHT